MPDISRLVADIAVHASYPEIHGHHKIQAQRQRQGKPVFLLIMTDIAQKFLHDIDGCPCTDSKQKRDAYRCPPTDQVEQLIDVCRKAVIPAVLNNHADMKRQIRLVRYCPFHSEISYRLPVEQKQACHPVNCRQDMCHHA